jgi:hypothetical protein
MTEVAGQTSGRLRFTLWTLLLVLVYAGTSMAGWQRTLLPDEIRPLLLAQGPASDLLAMARADIVQTPASYFVARAWLNLFGHTDAAAKALPLTLGILSIVLFAVLARRATRHWAIASFLFAGVFWRVGTSANLVRMYGLVILCSVVALLLWDAWRKRPGWPMLLAWAAVMTLAIYTHPSALLLLGALVIATWLLGPKKLTFTAGALVPVLALIPWLLSVYPAYRDRGLEANVAALADDPVRELARLPFYLLTADPPGALSPLEERLQSTSPALRWGALALVAALMLAAVPGVRRKNWARAARTPHDDWMITAALLTVLPVAVMLLVSVVTIPILSARYLLVTLPPLILLLTALATLGGRVGYTLIGAAAIWILASVVWSIQLHRPPSPARVAASYIAEHLQPNDIVIAGRHIPIGWGLYWEWSRRLGRPERIHVLPSNQPAWLRNILPAEELEQMPLPSAERVWFVNLGSALREEVGQQIEARSFTRVETGVQDMQFVVLYQRQAGGVQ